jgi:hypothetical protein
VLDASQGYVTPYFYGPNVAVLAQGCLDLIGCDAPGERARLEIGERRDKPVIAIAFKEEVSVGHVSPVVVMQGYRLIFAKVRQVSVSIKDCKSELTC